VRRYAAFLRGVSPSNAKMPELRRAFEEAGFSDVRTVLSSGNLTFSAPPASEPALERRAEAAMERRLGRSFPAIVRTVDALRALLASEPWAGARARRGEKRVVTFLRREPRRRLDFPIELDGARILGVDGREVFTAYVPGPRGAVFMALVERTFGRDVTTRTWETVRKVASEPAGRGIPDVRRAAPGRPARPTRARRRASGRTRRAAPGRASSADRRRSRS
jgi:uncharacterized protein (DUF1697 family)